MTFLFLSQKNWSPLLQKNLEEEPQVQNWVFILTLLSSCTQVDLQKRIFDKLMVFFAKLLPRIFFKFFFRGDWGGGWPQD